MKNMEESLLNGFTIYISSKDGKIIGFGLKVLGNQGMDVVELDQEEIKSFPERFPAISEQLEEGYLLQTHRLYICKASLGNPETEGPYGESKVLNVIEESEAFSLQGTLMDLEEKMKRINQTKKRKVLKKMYRPYGSDKYKQ